MGLTMINLTSASRSGYGTIPVRLIGRLFCLSFLLFPILARAADDLCDDVTTILQSGIGFATMRGDATSSKTWKSTRNVGRMVECAIAEVAGDATLRCQGNWTEPEQPDLEATSLARALGNCLGSSWRRQRGALIGTQGLAVFTNTGSNVEFEVSLHRREQASVFDAVGVPSAPKRQWQTQFVVIKDDSSGVSQGGEALGWRTDSSQFCKSLNEVVVSAQKRFESIKVAPQRSRWSVKTVLPGMRECVIVQLDGNDVYYTCDAASVPSRGRARAAQAQLAKDAVQCLGQGWEAQPLPRGDGMWAYQISQPDNKVSLRLRAPKARPPFVVPIDVDVE